MKTEVTRFRFVDGLGQLRHHVVALHVPEGPQDCAAGFIAFERSDVADQVAR